MNTTQVNGSSDAQGLDQTIQCPPFVVGAECINSGSEDRNIERIHSVGLYHRQAVWRIVKRLYLLDGLPYDKNASQILSRIMVSRIKIPVADLDLGGQPVVEKLPPDDLKQPGLTLRLVHGRQFSESRSV